jgi:hypothetical protein
MTDSTTGGNAGGRLPESRVKEDAEKARAEVEREIGSAAESLSQAGRMAQERTRSALGDAAQQARSYADSQKDAAAQSLKDFAEAVRRASDELGERDQTLAARFVQEAAGGLESLSRSVGSGSIEGMLDSVRDFGRSNPTAFIAGSVLAGIAIGRFALASNDRDTERYEHSFAGSSPGPGGRQAGMRPRRAPGSSAAPSMPGETTGAAAGRSAGTPGTAAPQPTSMPGASATTGSTAGQARSPYTPSQGS